MSLRNKRWIRLAVVVVTGLALGWLGFNLIIDMIVGGRLI